MSGQHGLRIGPLFIVLFLSGGLSAEPAPAGPRSSTPDRLGPQDILELFGEQGVSSDHGDEGGSPERMRGMTRGAASGETGLRPDGPGSGPTGSGGGSPLAKESQELKRPAGGDRHSGFAARASESKGVRRGTERGGWPFFTNLLPLLAVLALIALAALAVKRFLPARRLLTGSGVLEIVARAPLSSKQSLVLVKMGRRLVLLGVTGEQINTLCLVEDPDQVAMLLGEMASERPGSMTRAFAGAFREQTRAYAPEPDAPDASAAVSGHVRHLLEKVRQFTGSREVA